MSSVPTDAGTSTSPESESLYSRRMVISAVGAAAGLVGAAWYLGVRRADNSIGAVGPVGAIDSDAALLPRVGEPAPDLTAQVSATEVVTLSNFAGQPVWLNFWGSWCQPCRVEMPAMQAAHERLAPSGLVFIAVGLYEPLENSLSYAADAGVTYLVAGDPLRAGSSAYGVATFPTHILIDRAGLVQKIILATLEEDEFIAQAETILAPEATS